MAGLRVPVYEKQTRFVGAYQGPTATAAQMGSAIGKGLTDVGAGITDIGTAVMVRQAERQKAEDLNFNQTFKLGDNDDVYKDIMANRDKDALATGNATEAAQARWKKSSERRLNEMLASGYKPSQRALAQARRDAEYTHSKYALDHLEMVDQGRRLDITEGANRNLSLIHASAAAHGDFQTSNAEQDTALAQLREVLPPVDYAKVEEQARIGMGKSVVSYIVELQDKGLLAKDDQERNGYKEQAFKVIDEAGQLGYIEGAEVENTKRIWEDAFDKRAALSMDAVSRQLKLGGAPAADAGASYSYLFGKLEAWQPDTAVTGFQPNFAKGIATLIQSAPPEIGPYLTIGSGTRTNARQQEIWEEDIREHGGTPSGMVARPGHSQHEFGNAVDLYYKGKRLDKAPPEVIKAVHEHAAAIGLSFPMPGREPWHVEGPRGGADGKGGGATISRLAGVDPATLPAGMRNNNPGNIKFFSGADTSYSGVVGASQNTDQGDRQIVFRSPEAGMAAMAGLLMKKFNAGRTTVNQIIAQEGGWTPGNAAAAANVAKTMGVGVNDQINLADDVQMKSFMRALMQQEHGEASGHYTDQMVLAGITSARTGQPPVESGDDFTGIYGPQGNSFDNMPADTRREIILGAQAEMARGNEELKNGVTDYAAFLRNGGPPDGRYSTEELIYRMGEPLGRAAGEEIAAAAAYGQQVNALAMAPPEQVAAIRAERQAALATPEGFVQHQAEAAGIDKIIADRDKLIADDAGGYVADKDKDTRAAMGKYSSLPRGASQDEQTAAAHAWAIASLKAQSVLGVAKADQRILPDKVVEQIAAQFLNQPEGGQNAYEQIQGLQATWGKHWEQVFEQLATDGKVSGTVLVLGTMDGADQRLAGMTLANAAKTGTQELEKTQSPDTIRELKELLYSETDDFLATLAYKGDSGRFTYNTFNEGIYQLAIVYAGQGLSAADAMARAKKDVLDRSYTFKDTYRVPIEQDADTVERWATEFQQQVDPAGLTIPVSLMGVHPDDARAAYGEQVRSKGFWVTSNNEDGLTLYDETGRAVRNADGTTYTKTWQELTAGGEEVTYPSIVGGGEQPGRELVPGSPEAEGAAFEREAMVAARGATAEPGEVAGRAGGAQAMGAAAQQGVQPEPGETTGRTGGAAAFEPQPASSAQIERMAATRITQPERRLLAPAISLEQASRLARAGGDWRQIIIALAETDTPTPADIAAIIYDLGTKIPGNDPAKQALIEKIQIAGQAFR